MAQEMTASNRQFIEDLHTLPADVAAAFRDWLARCADEVKATGAVSDATWGELDTIG